MKPGDTLTYTLTVVNEGPVPVTGATVADDVSGLVDDATLATLPAGVVRTGTQLTWTVPTIPVGGIASVTYSAVVHGDALGATIANTAAPVGTGGHCTLSCSTSAYTDAWTLTKTSNPADGASVMPGTEIAYTLTVANTGGATLHGASVTDNLADVLDDATLGALPSGASVSGSTLTWAVPDVAAGATATLTYTATVNTGGHRCDPAEHRSPGQHRRRLRHVLQHHRAHRRLDARQGQLAGLRRRGQARRRDHLHADSHQHLRSDRHRRHGRRRPQPGPSERHRGPRVPGAEPQRQRPHLGDPAAGTGPDPHGQLHRNRQWRRRRRHHRQRGEPARSRRYVHGLLDQPQHRSLDAGEDLQPRQWFGGGSGAGGRLHPHRHQHRTGGPHRRGRHRRRVRACR